MKCVNMKCHNEGNPDNPVIPGLCRDCMRVLADPISNATPEERLAAESKARLVPRTELCDGVWMYIDSLGKDYGPYRTRQEADDRGPIAADREEKMLRRLP